MEAGFRSGTMRGMVFRGFREGIFWRVSQGRGIGFGEEGGGISD